MPYTVPKGLLRVQFSSLVKLRGHYIEMSFNLIVKHLEENWTSNPLLLVQFLIIRRIVIVSWCCYKSPYVETQDRWCLRKAIFSCFPTLYSYEIDPMRKELPFPYFQTGLISMAVTSQYPLCAYFLAVLSVCKCLPWNVACCVYISLFLVKTYL